MSIYANTYRIAINGAHAIKLIGPMMTLAQAQAYAADMRLGNFDVMVVNTATEQAYREAQQMTQRISFCWVFSVVLQAVAVVHLCKDFNGISAIMHNGLNVII